MAAGKGTRLKSRRPKVLHEVGGKPLLGHVIAAASLVAVAPADIYVIVGHQAERVREAVAATGVQFVEQTEQRGTGHAIQCARTAICRLRRMSGALRRCAADPARKPCKGDHSSISQHGAAMTILTAEPEDPTGYGRILRRSADLPEVEAIVEQKALTPEQHVASAKSTPASTLSRPRLACASG